MYRFLSTVILVTLLAGLALAETTVSGEVSGRWTSSGSPYVVTGDLVVAKASKLEIEDGVEIRFAGHYSLTVNGLLIVDGDGGDDMKLEFKAAADNESGWGGIRFINADGGCKLKSFSLTDGNATGSGALGQGGALYIENTDLEVVNCAIGECKAEGYGGAIAIHGGDVELTNIAIGECASEGQNGVVYVNNADLRMTNAAIAENRGIGLYVENKSDITLTNMAISEQTGEYGWGIYCRASDMSLTNTAISDNSAGGIRALEASDLSITTSAISGEHALDADKDTDVNIVMSAVDD